ncbi:Fe-S cluster assembly protein SufD [Bacteroidia bacterium]|nr:Fe-S cluster assembly protein SufD [Bacteroidia bacterium]
MTQYIDFFNSQRQKIEADCASLVNSFREKAFETFRKEGFPAFPSEDYRHTDVTNCLKADYGFYLDRSTIKIDPRRTFHCNLPHLNSYGYFLINGYFYEEAAKNPLPGGVFAGSLNRFAEQYPDVFLKYYNRQANEKGNGLTAFNTAFVQDGYVLYVPENRLIDKPLQLTNLFVGTIDALANRRILIILEAGAQAKLLICDHTAEENTAFAGTQVSEVYVGENAVFDLYELEESSKKNVRLSHLFIRQETSSTVMLNGITLSNGITRNNCYVDLNGEHAEIHLNGMAIADDRQQIDNFTLVQHHVPNGRSKELFKYVLDENAIGAFDGRIIVAPNAQKTEAYQNNRNLLSSNACRMYSKPQLEIFADDVKCSHGMTTGQLDENALFYLRSRGIPEAEAILLLKFAFTADVLQQIRIESLKDRLKLLVEKRFRGEEIRCQACI